MLQVIWMRRSSRAPSEAVELSLLCSQVSRSANELHVHELVGLQNRVQMLRKTP